MWCAWKAWMRLSIWSTGMPADMHRQLAAPLLVWLLSAALVAVLVTIACFHSQTMDLEERRIATAHALHILSAPHAGAETRMLAIGSSLLWAASPANYRLQLPPNRYLSWSRTIKNGFGLGPVGLILPIVEQYPPDVLVVETNLLLPNESPMALARLTVNVTLKNWLAKAAPRDPLQPERAIQPEDFVCPRQPDDPHGKLRANGVKYLRSSYQAMQIEPELLAALARLSLRGVRIMILNIQRSASVEGATRIDKQNWLAHLQHMLPAGPNVSYHTAPSYAQDSLYCDGMHLAPAGRKLFETWWWQELRQARMTRG